MKRIISLLIFVLFLFSCADHNHSSDCNEALSAVQTELDSLKSSIQETTVAQEGQISTFLTFQENNAEEAMNFYVSLFDNSKINEVRRYGKDGPAKEGTILYATFELNGSQFACSDSYITHEWTFTPGVSVFVNCTSNEELERLFGKLSENGQVLMPLDNYGWSERFAFVVDRFGVSWQLNLN